MGVPDQVSAVSFDDSDLAGWLRPGLTGVALPHLEMGRRAVRVLLAPGRAGQAGRTDLVPMPVRERGSVAAARRADGVAQRGLG